MFVSIPCRYQSCILRPLPQKCRGHLQEAWHGGVVRPRVPDGQRHPWAASRGGHRWENHPSLLQFRWAQWERNRRGPDEFDDEKMIAFIFDAFTFPSTFFFHFLFFILPETAAAHNHLLNMKVYQADLWNFCPFAEIRELGPILNYIWNKTALPLEKKRWWGLEPGNKRINDIGIVPHGCLNKSSWWGFSTF